MSLLRHEDPLTQACNRIALLLAGNTPFYPLYLWFILGRDIRLGTLLLSALSLPFFAATFFIARQRGLAGRVWLCIFASLNTAWVAWLLGPPAGVALFFLPCLTLSVLAFRATEPLPRALLTLLPFALYLALAALPHIQPFTPAEYTHLLRLNAISVTSLSAVLPYILGNARGEG